MYVDDKMSLMSLGEHVVCTFACVILGMCIVCHPVTTPQGALITIYCISLFNLEHHKPFEMYCIHIKTLSSAVGMIKWQH